jgi:hypothetical protein
MKEILFKLRDLMEKFWCRGSMAMNKYGVTCGPKDPEAIRFCLIGGVHHVSTSPEETKQLYISLNSELKKLTGNDFIVCFNDSATHAEIMQLINSCICNAQS